MAKITPPAPIASDRRFDIDWLRILAFGILIFYHVSMMYVSWGWHIKSQAITPALENLMLLVNPWRLTLLFLISGVGVSLAVRKLSLWGIWTSRSLRLLLPLLFAMALIIPPQMYYQQLQAGVIGSGYLSFMARYYAGDQSLGVFIPEYTHLWFVVYLYLYCVLVIPVIALMRVKSISNCMDRLFKRVGPWTILLIPAFLIALYGYRLENQYPVTHDPRNDVFTHALSLTAFLIGVLLSDRENLWAAAVQARKPALIFALTVYLLHIGLRNGLGSDLQLLPDTLLRVPYSMSRWAFIVAILGYGRHLLNRPSRALRYLNDGIFPFYILHQTLTITAGYHLVQLQLHGALEFILVTIATFGGCLVIYEYAIRPYKYIRPLFGLKYTTKKE
jgi:Acyltransferase family